MVSDAHSRQPWKSCSLSAFFPEPKDKVGWGSIACSYWSPAKTAHATEECGFSEEPASPARASLPAAAWGLSLPGPGTAILSVARCDQAFSSDA